MSSRGVGCEPLESRTFFSVTTYPLPLPAGDAPIELEAGPRQTMWAIDTRRTSLVRIATNGNARRFKLPRRRDLSNLVAGPDNDMWFLDIHGGKSSFIGRISPNGIVKEFAVPDAMKPTKLVAGPGGKLWFIASGGSKHLGPTLLSIKTNGRFHQFGEGLLTGSLCAAGDSLYLNSTEQGRDGEEGTLYRLIQLDANGQIIADGPGVNIPILQMSDGSIVGVASTPVSDSQVVEVLGNDGFDTGDGDGPPFKKILEGPQGSLWYVTAADTIGYVDTYSPRADVSVPNVSQVSEMALGGDGNFWLSDGKSNSVTVFNLGNRISNVPVAAGFVSPGTTASAELVSFRDFAPGAAAGRLKTQVVWSDGLTTDGTLTQMLPGEFVLSDERAFTNLIDGATTAATYSVTDIVTGQSITGMRVITNAYYPLAATPIDFSAVAGQTFQGNVAQVMGVDYDTFSSYGISINWGDGTRSAGTLVSDASYDVFVVGSHRYAQHGNYSVTVNVANPPDASGASQHQTSVTDTATVS